MLLWQQFVVSQVKAGNCTIASEIFLSAARRHVSRTDARHGATAARSHPQTSRLPSGDQVIEWAKPLWPSIFWTCWTPTAGETTSCFQALRDVDFWKAAIPATSKLSCPRPSMAYSHSPFVQPYSPPVSTLSASHSKASRGSTPVERWRNPWGHRSIQPGGGVEVGLSQPRIGTCPSGEASAAKQPPGDESAISQAHGCFGKPNHSIQRRLPSSSLWRDVVLP
jgi:hypothetical protein